MMWYGRFATTSYGGSTRPSRSWSSASPSTAAAARPRVAPRTARGGTREAPVQLDRRHGRARPRAGRAVRMPEARPDLEHAAARAPAPPRRGSPRGRRRRRGSSATASGGRAARPRGASAGPRPDRAWARLVDRAARHEARAGERAATGRASRSRPARSPAANRRAPAAPIIAPLSVQSAGPRHDQRHAAGLGLAGEPCAERAVRRDAAAEHDRPGADRLGRPDRLRHEHVDDRVLEAPRELRGRRRPAVGLAGSSGRQALVGARRVDRPARRGLEAREAEVVRVAEPRPREDRVVPRRAPRPPAGSPARPDTAGPAAGRPCRTPRPPRRRPSGRGAGRSGGRASRRGTCGRPTRSARRAGTAGSSRSASPGSSSQAA